MSAEHRKPAVAFALLALFAATLIGIQRADAQGGEFLAAVAGATVRVQGALPEQVDSLTDTVDDRAAALGPTLEAVLTEFQSRSERKADALVTHDRVDGRKRPTPSGTERVAAGPPVAHTAVPHGTATPRNESRPAVTPDETPGRRIGHRSERAPNQARHEPAWEQRRAKRLEREAKQRVELARLEAERRAERLEREADQRVELARLEVERRVERLERRTKRLERNVERRIEHAARRSSSHDDSSPLSAWHGNGLTR